jgi:hypothetical protein
MSEIEKIRGFLRAVRRRATLEASLRWVAATLAAAVVALFVLALVAAGVGPASFWPKLTGTVLTIITLLGVSGLVVGSLRSLRSDRGMAVYVGRRRPELASDLVSAVELSEAPPVEQPLRRTGTDDAVVYDGDSGFLGAFYGSVAAATRPIDVPSLVPLRRAGIAGGAFAGTLLLLAAAALLAPKTFGRGLALLGHEPTRFEGAAVSAEPLMADVSITYTYPAHTHLPERVVEGSTGDVVAPRGTKVHLRARLLRRAREVALLQGESGETGEIPVAVEDGRIDAHFMVNRSELYRLWLVPLLGRPLREDRGHRIVAESDQPPRVEIFGPADRLELATPRPVEVGFSASDDYGLGQVDLVYRIDDGGGGPGKEQRIRLKDAKGERASQGRTVFDPDLSSAGPGTTITYRIEARDNDGVLGPKIGSSRTLSIVVQDPRENLDEQLLRQREVLDRLIDNLGDRLETLEEDTAAGPPKDITQRLALWQSLHEVEEAQVAALGRVIDEQRRTGDTTKPVLAALASIADRLGRRLREENALLAQLRMRSPEGPVAAASFEKLRKAGIKHVGELETAILLLDDIIGRQRLEDLASLAQNLTDAYQRLQDLLARYRATKDPALRAQLEREIRDLKARIEQLAEKIATLKARNEVASEWQNLPNLDEALDRAKSFSNLLEKGDPGSLEKALSELGESLERVRKMLGNNAQEFGENRFPQENRAMSETLKKLGDLEGDERSLAGDSAQLAQEVDKNLEKERAAELEKFLGETKEKLERLKSRLGTTPPRDLGDDSEDELKRAQESAQQMSRLLPEREWGEARKEAERAVSSLRRLRRDLEKKAEKQAESRKQRGASGKEFEDAMKDAAGAAQEIASGLEKLVPKDGERMSPEQRGRSQGMSERQAGLGQRASELAREAAGKAGEAPDLDRAAEELKSIGSQMDEARGELAKGSAREGSGKARDAADRLAKLRESLQGENGQGSRNSRRELVRIPGADESKAPREWRQELMEAMREKAPEQYGDEVRKYYEELVK